MGLSGVEPLTSRLSGVRSNHLSYRPGNDFPNLVVCGATRYSASLAKSAPKTRSYQPVIPPLPIRCAAPLVAAWLGMAQGPPATLLWGGDAEGGAPFVEADPADPSQVRGFDVEVAEAIARGLRRRARFVQVQWSSIDQSVERRDFAIGLSGVEDTPARRARHAVTIPYFEFREVLAVRPGDRGRWPDLAALRGRRVA